MKGRASSSAVDWSAHSLIKERQRSSLIAACEGNSCARHVCVRALSILIDHLISNVTNSAEQNNLQTWHLFVKYKVQADWERSWKNTFT